MVFEHHDFFLFWSNEKHWFSFPFLGNESQSVFLFSFGEKNLIGLVFGANVALSAVVKSKCFKPI